MLRQRAYVGHQELRPGTKAVCAKCKSQFSVQYITDTLCAVCESEALCAFCPNRAGLGTQWCGKCHRN